MANITAFQRGAFQFKAFQIAAIGAPVGRFRHDLRDLERRLASQKSERAWFDEFVIAAKAATLKAEKTKSEKHRRALIYAAEAAVDAIAEAIGQERAAPVAVIAELQAAASATRATASIKHAEAVIAMAYDWMDEEEILMLIQ